MTSQTLTFTDSGRKATSRLGPIALTAALLLAAAGARAGTGTYTISSDLSGTFDGTYYSNLGVTFTLVGNTNDIVNEGGLEFLGSVESEVVTLAGIGTYTVDEPASLGTEIAGTETALDQYEPQQRNVFLWGTLKTVDLRHSFAAVGSQPFIEVIGDVIPTSGGNLQFDGYEGYGKTITMAGTVVPEPAAWALMLCGLGLGGAALRSRRRAAMVLPG